MARYKRDYSGERFTAHVNIPLTPSQRDALQKGAERAGTTISQHARELCLRRGASPETVARTRRSPEANIIVEQLIAIGNNLNQLAKVANSTRSTPQLHELKMTTDFLKVVFDRVLAL